MNLPNSTLKNLFLDMLFFSIMDAVLGTNFFGRHDCDAFYADVAYWQKYGKLPISDLYTSHGQYFLNVDLELLFSKREL